LQRRLFPFRAGKHVLERHTFDAAAGVEKPFPCPRETCKSSFVLARQLAKHERRHTRNDLEKAERQAGNRKPKKQKTSHTDDSSSATSSASPVAAATNEDGTPKLSAKALRAKAYADRAYAE
jgi:hypothetical protein